MKFNKELEKELDSLFNEAGVENRKAFMNELENLYGANDRHECIERFSKEKYLSATKWRS